MNRILGKSNQSWAKLRNTFVNQLLPALTWLAEKGGKLAEAFAKIIENSSLLQATVGTLVAAMVAGGIAVAIAWAPVTIATIAIVAALGLVILAVEDVISTFKGSDTVLRRLLIWATSIEDFKRVVQDPLFALRALRDMIIQVGEAVERFHERLRNLPVIGRFFTQRRVGLTEGPRLFERAFESQAFTGTAQERVGRISPEMERQEAAIGLTGLELAGTGEDVTRSLAAEQAVVENILYPNQTVDNRQTVHLTVNEAVNAEETARTVRNAIAEDRATQTRQLQEALVPEANR
jgi:hypothetical protein